MQLARVFILETSHEDGRLSRIPPRRPNQDLYISCRGPVYVKHLEWIALPTPEGVFVARVKYSRLSHYLPHTIVKMYVSAITSTSGFVTHIYSSQYPYSEKVVCDPIDSGI